jgi:hypothetical protein
MPIGSTQPFRPAGTVTVACGTSSVNGSLIGAGEAVLVFNATSSVAFITFGTDLTVVATVAAGTPIPPGARLLVHAGEYALTCAAVLASGSGNLYFTRGDGTVY